MPNDPQSIVIRENVFLKWIDRVVVLIFCTGSLWLGVVIAPHLPKHFLHFLVPSLLRATPAAGNPASQVDYVTREEWQVELNRTALMIEALRGRGDGASQPAPRADSTAFGSDESRPADRSRAFGRTN